LGKKTIGNVNVELTGTAQPLQDALKEGQQSVAGFTRATHAEGKKLEKALNPKIALEEQLKKVNVKNLSGSLGDFAERFGGKKAGDAVKGFASLAGQAASESTQGLLNVGAAAGSAGAKVAGLGGLAAAAGVSIAATAGAAALIVAPLVAAVATMKLFTAAARAAERVVTAMAHEAGQALEDVTKNQFLAQTLGTSVTSLKTLQVAADNAGISAEQMGDSVKTLQLQIEKANAGLAKSQKLFRAAGLDYAQLKGMDIADAYALVAQRLYETGNAFTTAGLLGSEAAAQIASVGPDWFAQAAEEAKLLGLALSDLDSQRIRDLKLAVDDVKDTWRGMATQLLVNVTPAVKGVVDRIVEWAKANGGVEAKMKVVAEVWVPRLLEGLDKAVGIASVLEAGALRIYLHFSKWVLALNPFNTALSKSVSAMEAELARAERRAAKFLNGSPMADAYRKSLGDATEETGRFEGALGKLRETMGSLKVPSFTPSFLKNNWIVRLAEDAKAASVGILDSLGVTERWNRALERNGQVADLAAAGLKAMASAAAASAFAPVKEAIDGATNALSTFASAQVKALARKFPGAVAFFERIAGIVRNLVDGLREVKGAVDYFTGKETPTPKGKDAPAPNRDDIPFEVRERADALTEMYARADDKFKKAKAELDGLRKLKNADGTDLLDERTYQRALADARADAFKESDAIRAKYGRPEDRMRPQAEALNRLFEQSEIDLPTYLKAMDEAWKDANRESEALKDKYRSPREKYDRAKQDLDLKKLNGEIDQATYDKALKDAHDEAFKEAKTLLESLETPARKYQQRIADIQRMVQEGGLTPEQGKLAQAKAWEESFPKVKQALDDSRTGAQKYAQAVAELDEEARQAGVSTDRLAAAHKKLWEESFPNAKRYLDAVEPPAKKYRERLDEIAQAGAAAGLSLRQMGAMAKEAWKESFPDAKALLEKLETPLQTYSRKLEELKKTVKDAGLGNDVLAKGQAAAWKESFPDAVQLLEEVKTPEEKLRDRLAKIRQTVEESGLSWDVYGRAVRKAMEEYKDGQRSLQGGAFASGSLLLKALSIGGAAPAASAPGAGKAPAPIPPAYAATSKDNFLSKAWRLPNANREAWKLPNFNRTAWGPYAGTSAAPTAPAPFGPEARPVPVQPGPVLNRDRQGDSKAIQDQNNLLRDILNELRKGNVINRQPRAAVAG
jgi:hypothetical protein